MGDLKARLLAQKNNQRNAIEAAEAITALQSQLAEARAERDALREEVKERDEWLQIVDTLPLDEFDRLGDYWIQRLAVVQMSQAIGSVFIKFAPEPIMARFRKAMRAIMHQAFVEGCIAGARNERSRAHLTKE
jgi:hypothetical protein